MKAKVLFVPLFLCLFFASCVKDGDFDALNHPIDFTGDFSPSMGLPIGKSEMSIDKLLGMWQQSTFKVYFDDNDLLTIAYDTTIAATVMFNNQPSKAYKGSGAKGMFDSIVVNTPLSGSMPIDLFKNASKLDSFQFQNAYININTFIKAITSDRQTLLNMIDRYHLQVSVTDATITIRGASDSTSTQLPEIDVEDLLNGQSFKLLDNFDFGELISMKPQSFDYKINLKVKFSPLDVIQAGISDVRFLVDSIRLDGLQVNTIINVDFPIKVKGHLDMATQMDLPFENFESALDKVKEWVDLGNDSYLALRFENAIPFSFVMNDTLLDADGNILLDAYGQPLHLYNANAPIAPAHTTVARYGEQSYIVADAPQVTLMKIPFTEANLDRLLKARHLRLGITVSTADPAANKHISVCKNDKMKTSLFVVLNPVDAQ